MKDYETMAKSVLERRDKYVAHRRTQMKKTAAALSCFCLVVLIGIGAYRAGVLSYHHRIDAADSVSEYFEVDSEVSTDVETDASDPSTEAVKENKTDTSGAADSGGSLGLDGDPSGYSIKTMISSYGDKKMDSDISVNNGGVVFSDALAGAMEQYGDEVKYHVIVELFSDGVAIDCADWEGNAEMERIASLGYTVAFETYFDGYVNHNYFTIHATLEDLENFPANEQYGYCIMLYGERLDTSAETQDAIGGTSFAPGQD
jgi:hypothetical protein